MPVVFRDIPGFGAGEKLQMVVGAAISMRQAASWNASVPYRERIRRPLAATTGRSSFGLMVCGGRLVGRCRRDEI